MMTTKILSLTVLGVLCAASTLSAQRGGGTTPSHTITASSDFGAFADYAGTVAYDAEASGTAGRFGVRAGTGVGRSDRAGASSLVTYARSRVAGDGVSIRESGAVRNTDPSVGASVGTSADAPGTAAPAPGRHSVQLSYPAIAQGTDAIVTVRWLGRASTGASATAEVDVDGDGTPDFSGIADGNAASAVLQVTAGANGVTIDIATSGMAAVAADGAERYAAHLAVYVREGTLPMSCVFTNFGRSCGADLNGSVGASLGLTLDVTNATPDVFGILAFGDMAAMPTPFPSGNCSLLVDRNRTSFGWSFFRTDANGDATINLRAPSMAMTVSMQAVLIDRDLATRTRILTASNGTELVCQ